MFLSSSSENVIPRGTELSRLHMRIIVSPLVRRCEAFWLHGGWGGSTEGTASHISFLPCGEGHLIYPPSRRPLLLRNLWNSYWYCLALSTIRVLWKDLRVQDSCVQSLNFFRELADQL